jgi:TPR repeat protein
MKIYNTKIKDIILNIIEQHTQLILWEKERFEEVINEYSVHYCEECYLINKAIEIGLFEVLLLNRHIPYEEHIDMLKITEDLKEEEALFMISIMDRVIKENEWFIQVVNIEEATKKALEECRARDLHVIALAYYDGLGTQQDYEKAYNLFLKASEYGDDKAYYYLGYMNANGLGVETNREQALAFYKEGAKLGLSDCQYVYAHMTKDIDLHESEDPRALYEVGMQDYQKGNFKEAFASFKTGSLMYDAKCLYMLGELCLAEEKVDEGIRYLSYAYYLFDKEAAYSLGMLFMEGDFVERNITKGVRFLRQAEEWGHDGASELLEKLRGKQDEDL